MPLTTLINSVGAKRRVAKLTLKKTSLTPELVPGCKLKIEEVEDSCDQASWHVLRA